MISLFKQHRPLSTAYRREGKFRLIAACAGITVMILTGGALAQDKVATEKPGAAKPAWLESGSVFSPEGCDFTVTFPEEPYTTKRCDPIEPTKNCSNVTTFTKVYGLDATLLFNVTCNKAADGMFGRYDDNVMRTTLLSMAKPSNLDKSETGFTQNSQAKMAVLLGSGKSDNGKDDMLYTAQLWIGHHSVFTLEGQLRGQYVAEADQLFAEILKTAKVREVTPEKPEDTADKKTDTDKKKK